MIAVLWPDNSPRKRNLTSPRLRPADHSKQKRRPVEGGVFMNDSLDGLLCSFLQVLPDGFNGFARGFGGVFGAIPHASGYVLHARGSVLHGAPSSFGQRLGTFADGFAGCLGRIPCALGHCLGTVAHSLGGGLNSITGFFDGLLDVLLGLITSGQTDRGRRHNEEVWFHSIAKREEPQLWAQTHFRKIAGTGR